jgi:protein TonB
MMNWDLQETKAFFLWGTAGLLSLALNMVLFSFMPALISDAPGKKEYREDSHVVNMIRIKPPDPERKKPEKKVEPKIMDIKRPLHQKKIELPKFAFEINRKFPDGPVFFPSPPMATLDFSHFGLKGAYEVGEIDGPLVAIAQVPPVYPLRAKSMGIKGWVKVKFLVNNQGLVENLEIIEAAPKDVFDTCTRKCVSAWRFSPGTVEGEPVNTRVITTIRFELE